MPKFGIACFCMVGNDVLYFPRLERDIPSPLPEATTRVYRFHPLLQSVSLGLVLWAVGTLDLKRKIGAVGKANEEIWDISAPRTCPQVVNLEPEMIILGIGDDVFALFEDVRRVSFPGRISDQMADMRLGGRKARLGGVPCPHLPSGTNRVFFVEYRRQAFRVLLGHSAENMLDDKVDVKRNQNPPSQWIRVE